MPSLCVDIVPQGGGGNVFLGSSNGPPQVAFKAVGRLFSGGEGCSVPIPVEFVHGMVQFVAAQVGFDHHEGVRFVASLVVRDPF